MIAAGLEIPTWDWYAHLTRIHSVQTKKMPPQCGSGNLKEKNAANQKHTSRPGKHHGSRGQQLQTCRPKNCITWLLKPWKTMFLNQEKTSRTCWLCWLCWLWWLWWLWWWCLCWCWCWCWCWRCCCCCCCCCCSALLDLRLLFPGALPLFQRWSADIEKN